MKRNGLIHLGIAVANLTVTKLAMAVEGTGPGEGMGVWTILFLGFGAAVILLQAVPALFLFGSMVSALFRKPQLNPAEQTEQAE